MNPFPRRSTKRHNDHHYHDGRIRVATTDFMIDHTTDSVMEQEEEMEEENDDGFNSQQRKQQQQQLEQQQKQIDNQSSNNSNQRHDNDDEYNNKNKNNKNKNNSTRTIKSIHPGLSSEMCGAAASSSLDHDHENHHNKDNNTNDHSDHDHLLLYMSLYETEIQKIRSWLRTMIVIVLILLLYGILLTILFWFKRIPSSSIQTPIPQSSSRITDSLYDSILLNMTLPQWKSIPNYDTRLTKLAFGSCSSQNVPQPYWDTILQGQQQQQQQEEEVQQLPDLFILMGDNVYADCDSETPSTSSSTTIDTMNHMNCLELQNAYQQWGEHPSLLGMAPYISILATLDDHDYGISDCDVNNPYKQIAQDYFISFFHIPTSTNVTITNTTNVITTTTNSETNQTTTTQEPLLDHDAGKTDTDDSMYYRTLPLGNIEHPTIRDGVYRAGIWGSHPNELVQIILLDTRYMRSPFIPTGDPHSPYQPYSDNNNDSDNNNEPVRILSERQWDWLYEQYRKPATLRIIISSIQVLTNVSGFECWRHVPKERERLYHIIAETTIRDSSRTIIFSGDRHVGGYYEYNYTYTMTTTTTTTTSTKDSNDTNIDNHNDTDTDSDFDTDDIDDHVQQQMIVPFIEITSSSLTHSVPYGTFNHTCTNAMECDEIDPYRIGDFIRENLFTTLTIHWGENHQNKNDTNDDTTTSTTKSTGTSIEIDFRKADSSYGAAYFDHIKNSATTTTTITSDPLQQHPPPIMKPSDAGTILQTRTYHL